MNSPRALEIKLKLSQQTNPFITWTESDLILILCDSTPGEIRGAFVFKSSNCWRESHCFWCRWLFSRSKRHHNFLPVNWLIGSFVMKSFPIRRHSPSVVTFEPSPLTADLNVNAIFTNLENLIISLSIKWLTLYFEKGWLQEEHEQSSCHVFPIIWEGQFNWRRLHIRNKFSDKNRNIFSMSTKRKRRLKVIQWRWQNCCHNSKSRSFIAEKCNFNTARRAKWHFIA